jgi:hypothetical protein
MRRLDRAGAVVVGALIAALVFVWPPEFVDRRPYCSIAPPGPGGAIADQHGCFGQGIPAEWVAAHPVWPAVVIGAAIAAIALVWFIGRRRDIARALPRTYPTALRDAAAGRVFLPGFVIAFVSLGVLGGLVGWEGASRAYSTGPQILLLRYTLAVAAVGLAAFLLALLAGRILRSAREVALTALTVLATDVIATLAAGMAIGDTTIIDFPRAILSVTAGGTQVVAAALGLIAGFVTGSASRSSPSANERVVEHETNSRS